MRSNSRRIKGSKKGAGGASNFRRSVTVTGWGGKIPVGRLCLNCQKKSNNWKNKQNRLFCSRTCYEDYRRLRYLTPSTFTPQETQIEKKARLQAHRKAKDFLAWKERQQGD